MTEIGSIQDLDKAMEAFKANPTIGAQAVLERAMRVYQCNVTAVEPVGRKLLWPPEEMDGVLGRRVN